MVKSPSYWSRGEGRSADPGIDPPPRSSILPAWPFLATTLCIALLGLNPAAASSQDDDLAATCRSSVAGQAEECFLAASAVRLIHPRVGTALWGGSPVPGSASTLGMRLGSIPRFTLAGRVVVLPMELPPLRDRNRNAGTRTLAGALSGQTTVGILPGWSPLPTVGGFMSLDATVRGSWLLLPEDDGFQNGNVLGGSVALRLGLLRESFTLPGISVTGSYGRSTEVSFGDPETDDGHIAGALGNWSLTGAVTKRVGPVGMTGGVALDRYTSDVEFSYRPLPPVSVTATQTAHAATDRWSAFGNLSWTFLVFHASLEAGWQESPTPEGLPAGVSLDPAGWWLGAAFRLSI